MFGAKNMAGSFVCTADIQVGFVKTFSFEHFALGGIASAPNLL